MKYRVCTRSYCNVPAMLGVFDTEEEAARFMTIPFVSAYADEMENADEDEIIYPSEMYIEEFDENEIPFSEPFDTPNLTDEELEMLPF